MARPRSETPTPAELEVLHVLWHRGPRTVRQVMDELNTSRRRAYTSVMSLLNVMTDKKLLRRKPAGRAFVYGARVKQKATLGRLVGELVDRAFAGAPDQLVAHALEETDPSPGQLERIARLIEQHRTRKGE